MISEKVKESELLMFTDETFNDFNAEMEELQTNPERNIETSRIKLSKDKLTLGNIKQKRFHIVMLDKAVTTQAVIGNDPLSDNSGLKTGDYKKKKEMVDTIQSRNQFFKTGHSMSNHNNITIEEGQSAFCVNGKNSSCSIY